MKQSTALTNGSATLATLAVEINSAHNAAETAARSAIEHALKAGRLLAQAKAKCSHGNWLDWLAGNFSGSARTARNYMSLASRFDALDEPKRQRVANLPMRQALQLLAESRDDEERATDRAGIPKSRIPRPALKPDKSYFMVGAHDQLLELSPYRPDPRYWHFARVYQLSTEDSCMDFTKRPMLVSSDAVWDFQTANFVPHPDHPNWLEIDDPILPWYSEDGQVREQVGAAR